MFNRLSFTGAICLMASLLTATDASAQPPAPGARSPTVSPYLNMLRQGNSPALNYLGLVRPEVAAMQNLQTVQSAVANNQRSISELYNGGGLPQTGVTGQFLNYRGYFLTQGSGGTGVGGGGGGGMVGGGGGGGMRR